MKKILKVNYNINDGNLIKFINANKIGIERKYPLLHITKISIDLNLDAEFVNIFYTLEG